MRKLSENKHLPSSDIGRFFERKFRAARETLKIPREIGWARPVRHPARSAISGARGAIWASYSKINDH